MSSKEDFLVREVHLLNMGLFLTMFAVNIPDTRRSSLKVVCPCLKNNTLAERWRAARLAASSRSDGGCWNTSCSSSHSVRRLWAANRITLCNQNVNITMETFINQTNYRVLRDVKHAISIHRGSCDHFVWSGNKYLRVLIAFHLLSKYISENKDGVLSQIWPISFACWKREKGGGASGKSPWCASRTVVDTKWSVSCGTRTRPTRSSGMRSAGPLGPRPKLFRLEWKGWKWISRCNTLEGSSQWRVSGRSDWPSRPSRPKSCFS